MSLDFKLYLITGRKVARKPLIEAVRLALEGGVRAVQLREKDLPVRELLSLAGEMRELTREFNAKLFINDRLDVAHAVGADGVHLGNESMPASAVRKVVGRNMLIGVSTHSIEEAKTAEAEGADFITFGPIFETPSKAKYGAPVGVNVISKLKNEVKLPIFAIGGVNSGNINTIINAGADGVAVISAILAADDITKAAAALEKGLETISKFICKDHSAPR